jgi:cbb3-type cytochrome oxidase maturation protein
VYKRFMEILYYLIPVSLVIVALAVGVFFWAVRSGQYDDLEGPAWRILYDEPPSRDSLQSPLGNASEPGRTGDNSPQEPANSRLGPVHKR